MGTRHLLKLRTLYISGNTVNQNKQTHMFDSKAIYFTLKGILAHVGEVNGGHYTAILRNPNNSWTLVDDDKVTKSDIPPNGYHYLI